MEHDSGCSLFGSLAAHSDVAKRASEAVNLHLSALGFDAIRKWVAIRLSDGGSDGTLYDAKRDAVRHQLHEQLCAYVAVPPGGMNACQAESFMRTNRAYYDAGWRLPDPDAEHGGRAVIPRLAAEDQARQTSALVRSKR